MLSTVPAFSLAEPGLVNPFLDFQTGFTPWDWDCSDLFSVIKSSLKPSGPDPYFDDQISGYQNTKTGSDESISGSSKLNSVTDLPSPRTNEPDSVETKILITGPDSGSEETNLNRTSLQEVDERKRKRMESNRESARRSRKRRQSHVENLRNQVNRLGLENRELTNRLRVVLYHIQRVSTDNDRLAAEQEILRRRLSEMRRILILRQLYQQQQWQRNNISTLITTQQNPSSIIHQIM